ncbi:MAG: hypothetical protein WC356_00740 [Candidatus Micrarchaeia archaeon]|jgi:eight-cysteine-cluster-containing protein
MKKIFLILIIFGVLFMFGCIEQNENKDKEDLILNSAEKQVELPNNYYISYLEKVQGIDLNIQTIRFEGDSVVITDSELDKKWIFLNSNENFICEQRKNDIIMCANTTSDERFSLEINSANSRFINTQTTNEAKTAFNTLIEEDALEFKKEIIEKTLAGRTCKEVEFMINYQKVSAGGLSKIGLSSTNPIVNKYKNFTQTICYDDEYGVPLYIKLSYLENGKEVIFERETLEFSEAVESSLLVLPTNTTKISDFYTYFAKSRNELNTLANCKNSENPDVCFKQGSISLENSNLCDYIEDETKKYQCLIIALTFDKNPELCEKIQNAEDKDACYLELTRNTANKEYCNHIINDTIENMCLELDISLPENIVECTIDADCSIQGCNHEICAPIDEEIMTDCQWKDIYSCYTENKTSCGCYDKKCIWEVTNELIECIDDYESKEVLADIKEKLSAKNETNQTNTETGE